MALRKSAELFPSSSAASSAHKAVDGNTSDAASSGACAQTTNKPHSWWKVDLGRPYLLTGIKIYNRERGGTFVCLFVCLFVCMFICLYVCVWVGFVCVYFFIHWYIRLCEMLSISIKTAACEI